jgi:hypothetical protein
MSTRGAIVRFTNGETNEFAGRYHHWDSYPAGLGVALWGLYHGHFQKDLRRMLEVLIDEHPAGWSTITSGDFSLAPGYNRSLEGEDRRPHCYCHGDRSEEENLITHKNAADVGCEYVYGFDEGPTLVVLSSYCADDGPFAGKKMIGMFGSGDPKATWKEIGRIPLEGPEPDWERIQCGENLERCGHIEGYHERS